MISPTFQNLKEDKKDRIIDAALAEFAARPFNEASITNIVKNADISRGSFYQYFGNKGNIYKYLVSYLYTKHREDLVHILIENNGELYPSLLEFYDKYIDDLFNSKYFAFYKNTFRYVNHYLIGDEGVLSVQNQSTNREEQRKQFMTIVKMDDLKANSSQEVLEYIYFLVNTIHHMVLDGFVNNLPINEIKDRSTRAVDWLYYGIKKDV
ncbi:MAG TPA: TetR family transcriptional regulator [Atopostipes sp.]|nr:TetR family transcriptional regulator [Atopostipes sp.]